MASALDEVSTEYGLLAEAVSYPDDRSSVTYRLRANAHWHDGKPVTPEDVIFSFDAFKTEQPAARRLLPARDQGGEDRRARGHLHLRRAGQPRTAADRRPAAGAAEALVGRHRQVRQEARRDADHAGAAARLRPLPDQGLRARPHASSTRGSPTIGARTSTSTSAATISTQIRFEYFRDSTVALEAFKGDQVDWRTENSAKNWATAYDFPAVRDKKVVLEEFPIRNSGVDAGLRLQHPARQVQGPARAPRLQLRLRFRGDEQADLLRPVQAHRQLFRGHRARLVRTCRRARSSKSCKACGTRCRRRCSPSPTPIRSAAVRRRCATICARRSRCCARPATRSANTKLVNAKTGEPFSVEFLVDDPATERFVLFYKPSLRAARHRR